MNIAFRVDSSKKLGFGHVNRCKILARNLDKKNTSCIFITQFKQTYEYFLSEGFIVFLIKKKNESEQINQILKKENCLKLVIDSKRKSIKQLTNNISKNIKIILIDNFLNTKSIDLTVISSVKNPRKKYPKNCIVGKEYVLHGIENLPKNKTQKNNSILISMGGSDKYNITKKIINSLLKKNINFEVNIVLGKLYTHEKQIFKLINNNPHFHVIRNPTSLTSLMQESTIGIITFGITVYESAICRLPVFVISHSTENHESSKLVEKYGWISYIGKHNKINYDLLTKNLLDLMNNKKELEKMKKNCSKIDGLGPYRVSEYIKKL
jgi:UDP-2,4-diacetamido-2,4,6-trideoxy-beta-L-altropyranose hydrolase